MKDENIFIVERDFAYAFLRFGKLFKFLILFIVLFVWFTIKPYESFRAGVLIVFGISFFNFFLLAINYYSKSKGSFEVNKTNKTILIQGEKILLRELQDVQKIRSFGDIVDRGFYIFSQVFLYASQPFFYYRFQYNSETYIMTCFMMSPSESEYLDFILMGYCEIKRKFYPFVI